MVEIKRIGPLSTSIGNIGVSSVGAGQQTADMFEGFGDIAANAIQAYAPRIDDARKREAQQMGNKAGGKVAFRDENGNISVRVPYQMPPSNRYEDVAAAEMLSSFNLKFETETKSTLADLSQQALMQDPENAPALFMKNAQEYRSELLSQVPEWLRGDAQTVIDAQLTDYNAGLTMTARENKLKRNQADLERLTNDDIQAMNAYAESGQYDRVRMTLEGAAQRLTLARDANIIDDQVYAASIRSLGKNEAIISLQTEIDEMVALPQTTPRDYAELRESIDGLFSKDFVSKITESRFTPEQMASFREDLTAYAVSKIEFDKHKENIRQNEALTNYKRNVARIVAENPTNFRKQRELIDGLGFDPAIYTGPNYDQYNSVYSNALGSIQTGQNQLNDQIAARIEADAELEFEQKLTSFKISGSDAAFESTLEWLDGFPAGSTLYGWAQSKKLALYKERNSALVELSNSFNGLERQIDVKSFLGMIEGTHDRDGTLRDKRGAPSATPQDLIRFMEMQLALYRKSDPASWTGVDPKVASQVITQMSTQAGISRQNQAKLENDVNQHAASLIELLQAGRSDVEVPAIAATGDQDPQDLANGIYDAMILQLGEDDPTNHHVSGFLVMRATGLAPEGVGDQLNQILTNNVKNEGALQAIAEVVGAYKTVLKTIPPLEQDNFNARVLKQIGKDNYKALVTLSQQNVTEENVELARKASTFASNTVNRQSGLENQQIKDDVLNKVTKLFFAETDKNWFNMAYSFFRDKVTNVPMDVQAVQQFEGGQQTIIGGLNRTVMDAFNNLSFGVFNYEPERFSGLSQMLLKSPASSMMENYIDTWLADPKNSYGSDNDDLIPGMMEHLQDAGYSLTRFGPRAFESNGMALLQNTIEQDAQQYGKNALSLRNTLSLVIFDNMNRLNPALAKIIRDNGYDPQNMNVGGFVEEGLEVTHVGKDAQGNNQYSISLNLGQFIEGGKDLSLPLYDINGSSVITTGKDFYNRSAYAGLYPDIMDTEKALEDMVRRVGEVEGRTEDASLAEEVSRSVEAIVRPLAARLGGKGHEMYLDAALGFRFSDISPFFKEATQGEGLGAIIGKPVGNRKDLQEAAEPPIGTLDVPSGVN